MKADPGGLPKLLLPVLLARQPPKPLRHLKSLTDFLAREQPRAVFAATPHINLLAIWARKLAGVNSRIILGERIQISHYLGERSGWRQRMQALSKIWGVLLLFIIVMGGIYFGLFTPTEAAGIGSGGAFLFAIARRKLTLRILFNVLVETARTSAMMFILLIGAIIFSNFINIAGLPAQLSTWLNTFGAAPMMVMLCILAVYIALGCLLESLSMILLTIPIFFPIVKALGFDPVWFGVIIVVVVEIGMITPPIGLNVFVLKATLKDVPVTTIFRGVGYFILADIVRLALFVLVPQLVLFLPGLM